MCVCILDGHVESWQLSLPSVLWKFEEKQTKVPTTHIGKGQCRTSRMSTDIVQTSWSALFPKQWATSQWTILREPPFPSDVIPCLKAATVKGGVCVTHRRNQWHFSLLPLCVQEQNKTVGSIPKWRWYTAGLHPEKVLVEIGAASPIKCQLLCPEWAEGQWQRLSVPLCYNKLCQQWLFALRLLLFSSLFQSCFQECRNKAVLYRVSESLIWVSVFPVILTASQITPKFPGINSGLLRWQILWVKH